MPTDRRSAIRSLPREGPSNSARNFPLVLVRQSFQLDRGTPYVFQMYNVTGGQDSVIRENNISAASYTVGSALQSRQLSSLGASRQRQDKCQCHVESGIRRGVVGGEWFSVASSKRTQRCDSVHLANLYFVINCERFGALDGMQSRQKILHHVR